MPKKVDANQPEIVDALRDVGAVWIKTSGDPTIGFDGIVAYKSKLFIVEIKNGELAPSARKLTDKERERKYQLNDVGVPYWIIASVDDALKMIGALSTSSKPARVIGDDQTQGWIDVIKNQKR